MRTQTWLLVLAAGAGRRLARVTGDVPKQFFRPEGGPSLLEQTLDRFTGITPASRTVTVVDRSHRQYLEPLRLDHLAGDVQYQPGDQGTAAGVMMGLSVILERAPGAMVLMTPSDHAVARPSPFRAGLTMAMNELETGCAEIVLFGAEPDHASTDYGWIAAAPSQSRLRPVDAFVEKPAQALADRLLRSGAVWNTMILLARARALDRLFTTHAPDLAEVFAHARTLSTRSRAAFLADCYPHLSVTDFSRDVLTPASGLSLYTWPASTGWSDLGTPERFAAWQPTSRPRPAPRCAGMAPALLRA